MNEIIRLLIENIDAETRWALREKTASAVLVGAEKSAYLRAAMRKADLLRIRIFTLADLQSCPRGLSELPVVADRDQDTFWGVRSEQDPDNLMPSHRGMSCVAEAVYLAMAGEGMLDPVDPVHVVLVGRGHAVKGLEERLLARDATVTVCHSKTKNIGEILKTANVVVYCADTVSDEVFQSLCIKEPVVFDVSGAVAKAGRYVYASASDLGKLNVSILMNRIATGRR